MSFKTILKPNLKNFVIIHMYVFLDTHQSVNISFLLKKTLKFTIK